MRRRWRAAAAAAACLIVASGTVALRPRSSVEIRGSLAEGSAKRVLEDALARRKSLDALMAAQNARMSKLQAENSTQHRDVKRLQMQVQSLRDQLESGRTTMRNESEARAANEALADDQIRNLTLQRDRLSAQFQDTLRATEKVENELATAREDRTTALLRQAELQARVTDLAAANEDQERRLADSEQFLSSDRDIRELMGARNLYIADVFDVDSSSRTRKPFGRVFYTRGKSLIFYAFDLDRQPRVKNTSTFQVWGEKETVHDQQAPVRNLGILYLDSESNRRWIMRYDDPKTLAEIDSVFVTVEPHGGSAKPTTKPFLYAILLKQANHP